jgi:hypothetical protein
MSLESLKQKLKKKPPAPAVAVAPETPTKPPKSATPEKAKPVADVPACETVSTVPFVYKCGCPIPLEAFKHNRCRKCDNNKPRADDTYQEGTTIIKAKLDGLRYSCSIMLPTGERFEFVVPETDGAGNQLKRKAATR